MHKNVMCFLIAALRVLSSCGIHSTEGVENKFNIYEA